MAFTIKRGDAWYAAWLDASGRRQRKATTARTKAEAQRLAEELEHAAERQHLGLAPTMPADRGGLWTDLVRWCAREFHAGDQQWGSRAEHHLLVAPFVGVKVADVTPEFIERWLTAKAKEKTARGDVYSPSTLNGLRAHVSGILTKARRAGKWRGMNAARDVEKRRVPRKVYDFLRPHEVAPTIRVAVEMYGETIACAFALALYAGLRRGEVMGLRKNDVDLVDGTLVIRRSHGKNRVKGGAEAKLPIHPELRPLLEASMASTDSDFVCPGEDGERMTPHLDLEGRLRTCMAAARVGITSWSHCCRAWHCRHRVATKEEVAPPCPTHGSTRMHSTARSRRLSFHDLRRSCASLLAAAGVSQPIATKVMRHTDPKLTANVYTVVDVETLRAEMERVRLLPPGVPTMTQDVDENGTSAPGSRAAVASSRGENREWLGPGSNREPTDYETVALTS